MFSNKYPPLYDSPSQKEFWFSYSLESPLPLTRIFKEDKKKVVSDYVRLLLINSTL